MVARRLSLFFLVVSLLGWWSTPAAASAMAWKKAMVQALQSVDRQDLDEAVRAADQALQIAERRYGGRHLFTMEALELLAALYRERREDDRAMFFETRLLAARLANAEEAFRKTQRRFGARHRVTATAMLQLAQLYRLQNANDKAEELLRRALAIREAKLGPNHPDVAEVLDEMAEVNHAEGRRDEVLTLRLRAWLNRQAKLGPNHAETIQSVVRLGQYYAEQGDLGAAEHYYRLALSAQAGSPQVARLSLVPTLFQLAQIELSRGDYAQAEPALDQVLAIQQEYLGEAHADLLETLRLLALVTQNLKKYEAAQNYLQRELSIYTVLGAETSREAAVCLESLASVYAAQRQNLKAEAALDQALRVRRELLGADHPNLLDFIFNLAEFNLTIGNVPKAQNLFLEVVSAKVDPLDPHTQLVADALTYLGNIAADAGQEEQAERYYREAVARHEAVGPGDAPRLAQSLNALARFLMLCGRLDEADPLLKRALALQEESLGKDHLDLAVTLSRLGELASYYGEFGRADAYYQRALQLQRRHLGPNHPSVAVTLNDMALVHHNAGDRATAERGYRQALEIITKLYGEDHPLAIAIKHNLEALRRNEEPPEED